MTDTAHPIGRATLAVLGQFMPRTGQDFIEPGRGNACLACNQPHAHPHAVALESHVGPAGAHFTRPRLVRLLRKQGTGAASSA